MRARKAASGVITTLSRSLAADLIKAYPVPLAPTTVPAFERGRALYGENCASCHGEHGEGKPPHWPPLANNQSIEMQSAVNPIRMVLNGGYPPGTKGNPMPYGMPPFAGILSDNEIAAVVSYIRTAWGNRGTPVSAREANELRSAPLN